MKRQNPPNNQPVIPYSTPVLNPSILTPPAVYYNGQEIEFLTFVLDENSKSTSYQDWLKMDMEHSKNAWYIADTESETRIKRRRINRNRVRNFLDFRKLQK
ncbi:hypothetical protein EGH90_04405 [Kaistella haifensis]|nr:hypothetical protein EGH90_04405 [Kaistella haifensis]